MYHLQCGDSEVTDEGYRVDEGVVDAEVERCCEDGCNEVVLEEGVKCWDCWSWCVNGTTGLFNGCQEELEECQEKMCSKGCKTVRYQVEGDYIERRGCEGSVECVECNETLCSEELCNTLAEECQGEANKCNTLTCGAEDMGTKLASWLLFCFVLHGVASL